MSTIFEYANRDYQNIVRILNLPDAILAQQPVTLAQLEAATLGLSWKDNARVAATGNINLASPGATIDGVTLANGDRVVLSAQTNASQNGIYIWSGATSALVRSPDADTTVKLENAIVTIDEGTVNAGATFRQTQVNFVLETGSISFATFFPTSGAATETSAGVAEIATQTEVNSGLDDSRIVTALKLANSIYAHRGFAADIGDGTTTTFTLTHNFNTQDIVIQVRRNSGDFDFIEVCTRATTANTAQVVFAPGLAPTAAQYRVLITRVV